MKCSHPLSTEIRTCLNPREGTCAFCQQDFCRRHLGGITCPEAPMSRWGRLPHVSPEILDAMGKPELKQPRTVRVAREQGSSKRVTVRAAISVLLPREKRHQHLNITEKPGSVTYLGGREGCEPDAELREWLATRVGPTALTRSFRWGTLNMAEADLRGLLEWEWGWEIRNREGETKR